MRVVSTAMVTSSAILTRLRGSKRATMVAESWWPSSSMLGFGGFGGLGGPHGPGVEGGVDEQIRAQRFDELDAGPQAMGLGGVGVDGCVLQLFGPDPDRDLAAVVVTQPGVGGQHVVGDGQGVGSDRDRLAPAGRTDRRFDEVHRR